MEEEKKKSILKLGLIEIGIVLVVIVVILGVLHYFNALPFSSQISRVINFLPQQEIAPQGAITGVITPSPDPSNPTKITVTSENPKYTLSLQNEKKLVEYFNSWGIYNKRLYTKLQDINTAQTISKITVILEAEEQATKLLSNASNQEPYLTYSTEQSGDSFIIHVWAADSALSQVQTPEERGEFVTYAVASILYNLAASQDPKSPEERENDFNAELSEFAKTTFFIISPK